MSNDIEELTALNRDYVASVQNCDVKRFDQILAPDFYCSNPDKSLVDRAAFLKQTAVPVTIRNLRAEDVEDSRARRFRHHPRGDELHDGRRAAGAWAVHRLLGEAERPLARGVGACVAVIPVIPGRLSRDRCATAGIRRYVGTEDSVVCAASSPAHDTPERRLTHRT